MAQLSLMCPTADDLAEARDGITRILELGERGELDVPPYLDGLLRQLREILVATAPQPNAS